MAATSSSAFKMAAGRSTRAGALCLLLLCLLVETVQGEEIKEENGVLVLTDANFKEEREESNYNTFCTVNCASL